MLKSINHIGIAVRDLDTSIETFRKLFEFDAVHREEVPKQMVKVASFKVGDVLIELTQPTSENSPVHKYIEKRGEGIHHIAFESTDINSELDRLKNSGVKLINNEAQKGAHDMMIAFAHPKSTNGVLTEICQPPKYEG